MRKLLCGAAAAVCLGAAGSAMANGSMKDVVVVEPAPLWSGCYLGLNVGGLWNGDNNFKNVKKTTKYYDVDSKSEVHVEYEYDKKQPDYSEDDYWKPIPKDYFSFNDDDNDVSPYGGLHIGCNWESDRFGFGNLVYGIESDIGFGDDIDYLATIRARVGAAWGRSLIYITGGVAFAQFDRDFEFYHEHKDAKWHPDDWKGHEGSTPYDYTVNHFFDNDNDETGWVIGLGWEYLIDQNFAFGIEGLYYMFDDDNGSYEFVDGKNVSDPEHYEYDGGYYHKYKFERETEQELYVVRARLSYFLRRPPEPLK